MSEKIIVCCDRCNEEQSSHPINGRGVVEACSEQDAIDFFEWKRLSDGKIICINCQDDDEKDLTGI